MAKVGFARVSTIAQELDMQIAALKDAKCDKIFSGKKSGVSKENDKQLSKLIDYIRDGDIVIVTKLDRLGRSIKAILSTIDEIHAKKATLCTLDGSIDTSNSSPLAKAFRAVIALFAELERDLIISRTSEGRENAKNNGVKFGPPIKITDDIKRQVLKDLKKSSVMEVARKHCISHTSVGRIRKEAHRGA